MTPAGYWIDGAITQSCGFDVGPPDKIVWVDVFAEMHEEDCEISDFA